MTNITEFQEGTMKLALEGGFPVLSPAGTFVHDARAAWFIEAIERWHVGQQSTRDHMGWFHASSLGNDDERLLAEYRGEWSERHDARRLRIFDLGHDRDRSWKRYMEEAGLTIRTADPDQLRMRVNWLRLTGECDGIALDPDGKLCIIEIKTKAHYMFQRLGEPDPAHVLQCHAYMGGLGIRQSIVVYEGKNTGDIKTFYVPFSDDVWSGIVARLTMLRAIAEGDATE